MKRFKKKHESFNGLVTDSGMAVWASDMAVWVPVFTPFRERIEQNKEAHTFLCTSLKTIENMKNVMLDYIDVSFTQNQYEN